MIRQIEFSRGRHFLVFLIIGRGARAARRMPTRQTPPQPDNEISGALFFLIFSRHMAPDKQSRRESRRGSPVSGVSARRQASSHTCYANIHAAALGDKVVAAPSAARVGELLARLGGRVVVVARNGGGALPPVQRIQTQHRNVCQIR